MKKQFLCVAFVAMSSFPADASFSNYVEVDSYAESCCREPTEKVALVRLFAAAWRKCASQRMYGNPKTVQKYCNVLRNINGFDASCRGLFECQEGPEHERYFIEGEYSYTSRDESYGQNLTQIRVRDHIRRSCEAREATVDAVTMYGFWYSIETLYNEWRVTYFEIAACGKQAFGLATDAPLRDVLQVQQPDLPWME